MEVDVLVPQGPKWLTTKQVKEQYGFDPRPYVNEKGASHLFIKNKLVKVSCTLCDDDCIVEKRVWLEDMVGETAEQLKRIHAVAEKFKKGRP